MVVNVKNEGENAYMTQVKVNLPEVVHFRSIPSVCVEQNATLLCDVDNPLTQNSQVEQENTGFAVLSFYFIFCFREIFCLT